MHSLKYLILSRDRDQGSAAVCSPPKHGQSIFPRDVASYIIPHTKIHIGPDLSVTNND